MKKISFASGKSKLRKTGDSINNIEKIKIVIKQTEYKAASANEYTENYIRAYEKLAAI